jgi:hypothetical protein
MNHDQGKGRLWETREGPYCVRIGAVGVTTGLPSRRSDVGRGTVQRNRVEESIPRPYSPSTCNNTDVVYSGTGVHNAPDEKDGARPDIANQEDKGAVYGDFHLRLRRH